MTARFKQVGDITVYAGTALELAVIADEYAKGTRSRPRDYHPELFRCAAELLRTGRYPALDLGAVRFYRDHRSGKPFTGPFAPDPDEAWARRQRSLGVLLRG